jgi:hypothetical protein
MEDIPELLSSSPLECFQLYFTPLAQDLKGIQLEGFIATLISTHGPRLKRLSINRLPISPNALYGVCTGFPNLEQLFTIVEQEDLVSSYLRI